MNKNFEGLIKQILEKPFNRMLYTVYNFVVDEGYVNQLVRQGIDADIDDLEFIKFDICEEEKENIKKGKCDKFKSFRTYIEQEIQGGKPVLCIFIMKDYGAVVAVKPKNYDFRNIEI